MFQMYCDQFEITTLESLSGPVGSSLNQDIWREPVVSFTPIPGKVPVLPEAVVQDLSRDQKLGYRYAHAIMTGIFFTMHCFSPTSGVPRKLKVYARAPTF